MHNYCIVPKNQEYFWDFINKTGLTSEERIILQQCKIKHVEVNPKTSSWEIVLRTQNKLALPLLDKVSKQLIAQCGIKNVFFNQIIFKYKRFLLILRHYEFNIRDIADKSLGFWVMVFFLEI